MKKQINFTDKLFSEFNQSLYRYYIFNYDISRFPKKKSLLFFCKQFFNKLIFTMGYVNRRNFNNKCMTLAKYTTILPSLDKTYNLLQDDYSKNIFIQVVLFRILGPEMVKLPLNTQEYWRDFRRYTTILPVKNNSKIIQSHVWNLQKLDLNKIGYNLKLIDTPKAIHTIFGLKQYEYHRGDVMIKPNPGDYVIDGGACWGDASFYFASQVGGKGKVYSFEFVPSNIKIIKQNIGLNLNVKKIVEIIPHPLFDISDNIINYSDFGPSSSINFSTGPTAKTINIDDFVKKYKVKKIDYIKMDIEGSELSALKGALNTLEKFKPKLAISVYHKDQDMYEIPLYLESLNLGYKFYLDHFTIHREETVLFASAKL